MNKKILQLLLVFVIAFTAINLFFPKDKDQKSPVDNQILLTATPTQLAPGDRLHLTLTNNTGSGLTLTSRCPAPLVDVYRAGNLLAVSTTPCTGSGETITVGSGSTYSFTLDDWHEKIFTEPANYRLTYNYTVQNQVKTAEATVSYGERGWFSGFFYIVLFKPIYNGLIFFTEVIPGGSLGWAIILITILVRLLLLVPNQKALESQKAMQQLQPKINAIQEKHKGDQAKISEETMKLWKEHKVNPFGGCLPMLIQLPILIELYYAVQTGITTPALTHLYAPLQDYARSLIANQQVTTVTNFYGLDLMATGVWPLAIIIGVLQFWQMSITVAKKTAKAKDSPAAANPFGNLDQNKIMKWIFPLLIMFLSISFPAGVGLYWGFSTLFGIGQQILVNRKKTAA